MNINLAYRCMLMGFCLVWRVVYCFAMTLSWIEYARSPVGRHTHAQLSNRQGLYLSMYRLPQLRREAMQSWLSGEVSIISLGKGNNNAYDYIYRPSYNLQGIITKLGMKLGYSSELHGAWTRAVGHIIDYCSLGYLFAPFAYFLSRNQISLQGYRALK